MKERMTISVDKEIYELLQELPRKVSLSEVITWSLRATFQDIKAGRELNSEEFEAWLESTPEGKDFRDRLIKHWGPTIRKLSDKADKIKKKAESSLKSEPRGKLIKT
jgi:predicted CopG family antitoxin